MLVFIQIDYIYLNYQLSTNFNSWDDAECESQYSVLIDQFRFFKEELLIVQRAHFIVSKCIAANMGCSSCSPDEAINNRTIQSYCSEAVIQVPLRNELCLVVLGW